MTRGPAPVIRRRVRSGYLSQNLRFGLVLVGSELTTTAFEGEMMYMICCEPLRTTRPLAATVYVSVNAIDPLKTPALFWSKVPLTLETPFGLATPDCRVEVFPAGGPSEKMKLPDSDAALNGPPLCGCSVPDVALGFWSTTNPWFGPTR